MYAPISRFSRTVICGNTPLPPGQQADAVLHPLLGRDVGDRRAVQAHDAARRRAEPGDHPQDRRLAGAVRAEQREHLAPPDLEADVEQHLHVAVGEVDVVDLDRRARCSGSTCWRRCSSSSSRSSATTSDRSCLMVDAPRMTRSPPMSVRRHAEQQHGAPRPDGVREERGEQRAAGGADEEHVDRAERGAEAAQPVGHDRLQHRADHRERGDSSTVGRTPTAVNSDALGMTYWIGRRIPTGTISRPSSRSARRVAAEQGVVALGGERQHDRTPRPLTVLTAPRPNVPRAARGRRPRARGPSPPTRRAAPARGRAPTTRSGAASTSSTASAIARGGVRVEEARGVADRPRGATRRRSTRPGSRRPSPRAAAGRSPRTGSGRRAPPRAGRGRAARRRDARRAPRRRPAPRPSWPPPVSTSRSSGRSRRRRANASISRSWFLFGQRRAG